jgi:hypothetical protein
MQTCNRFVIVLGLLVLTAPARGAEPAADTADPKELPGEAHARAALATELKDVRLDGAGLAEAVDFFRDVSGENIYVDWPALAAQKVDRNAPVTLNVQGTTLADALTSALKQAGAKDVTATPVGFVIVLSTPDRTRAMVARFRRLADKPQTRQQRSQLDRPLPELNFDQTGFEDVVNFLCDVSGVTFTVDWKALERAGVAKNTPITLRMKKIPFGQVLQLVLEAAGEKALLDFTMEEKGIAIGPEAGPV